MGQDTKIQWTDCTFNAWMGCSKAHTGCTNCYAERALPVAMRPGGRIEWGEVWQGGQRVVKADAAWREPVRWGLLATQKGLRRRVFCSSLADVLEVPELPKSWPRGWSPLQIEEATRRVQLTRVQLEAARSRLWDLIRKTYEMCSECGAGHYQREALNRQQQGCGVRGHCWGGGLDWLLLTKRPEHWALVPEDVRRLVWLGTSVSDQETADRWVDLLVQAQGFRVLFLSLEPMVGPVNLSKWLMTRAERERRQSAAYWAFTRQARAKPPSMADPAAYTPNAINWVIVGGESGPRARPCNVAWVEDIVKQCADAGVPVFVKQLGEVPVMDATAWEALSSSRPLLRAANRHRAPEGTVPIAFVDRKAGVIEEWSPQLRVRQLPHGVGVEG